MSAVNKANAINKTRTERAIIDMQDLEDCKTTGTGLGIIASSVAVVGSLLAGNRTLTLMSVCSLASSVFGHNYARESAAQDAIQVDIHSLCNAIEMREIQIRAKNKLIRDQNDEIEKLKKINGELEEKVQKLEQVQKSFEELNAEHVQILEEKRECLATLTGFVQGYEQRKIKLLEEIREARAEREKLQQDIKSLLAEQKKINEELAKRIAELGDIANQMQNAIKI